VHNGEKVVGGLCLAPDPWDVHVGPCLSVFAQYVLPEFRLQGVSARLMREALRIAKKSGVPALAFTHRKGPWRYETIYRKVNT
jgi:GNAT superfamily N-acetyltransferase